MAKAIAVEWDRNRYERRVLDTGRVGDAVVELVQCPGSGLYKGHAFLGEKFVEIGGTWGVPKAQARRAVVSAARAMIRSGQ